MLVITSLFAPFLASLRKRLKDPRIPKEELTNHGLKSYFSLLGLGGLLFPTLLNWKECELFCVFLI